jgi:nucleoside-diphosphate-sugar epimerase
MKLAIIGTGWLGHPLANKLASAGHEVYGSKRSVVADQPRSYRFFLYSPADAETQALLQTMEVVVLTFPPDRSKPDQYANDCLEVGRLLNDQCRVIITSSTSVYTATSGVCREEDVDLSLSSDNPIIRAEQALHKLLGERLTIIRLAGLTGPGRYPVIAMSKSGKTYEGNEPVNLIHQTDAVNLIAYVVEQQITGTIINGCAGEHPLRGAFYTEMAEKLGIPAPKFVYESKAGKIISSEHSREFGFKYRFDSPNSFEVE